MAQCLQQALSAPIGQAFVEAARTADAALLTRLTTFVAAHPDVGAYARFLAARDAGGDEVVVLGGHIDSWDVGTGAIDDGAGSVTVMETIRILAALDLPGDWLKKMAEKHLSEAEKAEIEALGGFDKLMETLKKRREEQEKQKKKKVKGFR